MDGKEKGEIKPAWERKKITLIYAGNGRSRYKIRPERTPAAGPSEVVQGEDNSSWSLIFSYYSQ